MNYNDIDKKNVEIAEKIKKSSELMEVPSHKSLDELIKPKKKINYKKSFASIAVCAVLMIAIFWGQKQTGPVKTTLPIGTQLITKQEISGAKKGSPTVNEKSKVNEVVVNVKTAKNDNEIYDIIRKTKAENNGNLESKTSKFAGDMIAENSMGAADSSATAMSAESSAKHSTTNVQTKGVDEEDIVKTDGKYIYSIVNQGEEDEVAYLVITKVKGTKVDNVSKVKLSDDYDNQCMGLYIYDQYVSVIMNCWEKDEEKTYIYTYNLKDAKNPILVSKNKQDGEFVSSRLIGKILYVVSTKRTEEWMWKDKKVMPYVNDCAVNCKSIYIPTDEGDSFVVATTLDMTNSKDYASINSVLGSGDTVYASIDNLYVINNYEKKEDKKVGKIKKSSIWNDDKDYMREYVAEVFDNVKKNEVKVKEVNKQKEYTRYCDIIKFKFEDGKLKVQGKTSVKGNAESNMFFDEQNGYLKFVTTNESEKIAGVEYKCYDKNGKHLIDSFQGNEYKIGKKTTSVVVLDKDLKKVARINGLAKNEDLYAARYIGDYGYFVTFENTDPLFSVDFTDIENPKIVSELKIPGYSTFLAEFNEGELFGFGEETKGNVNYLKLEMFDISNHNAKRKSKLLIGKIGRDYSYCSSDAVYDYKALLYDVEKNMIGFGYWQSTDDEDDYFYTVYKYEKGTFKKIINIKIKEDGYPGALRGIYVGNYFYVIDTNGGIYSLSLKKPEKVSYKKLG